MGQRPSRTSLRQTFAYNADALGLLAKQSAYSRVGTVLLVASLLPQMWIGLSPTRFFDLKVDRRRALAAAGVAVVVWVVALLVAQSWADHLYAPADAILNR